LNAPNVTICSHTIKLCPLCKHLCPNGVAGCCGFNIQLQPECYHTTHSDKLFTHAPGTK